MRGMFRLIKLLMRLVKGGLGLLTWLGQLSGRAGGVADGLLSRWLPASESARRRRRANELANELLAGLHQQGLSRRGVGGELRRVQFVEPLLTTTDEVWCPLDVRGLPTGVTTAQLEEPDILRTLEDRCHTGVRVDRLANGQICLVAGLRRSRFPNKLSINDFQLPVEAPLLAIPLGAAADGAHTVVDLTEIHHLLIVGASGNGKTTFIHAFLYVVIERASYQDVELYLVDLKGGAELGRYEALLNSRNNPEGIVRQLAVEAEAAVQLLDQTLHEIHRRNAILKQHSASNLADLESVSGQRLRRRVVVVDEIAILMLNKSKLGRYTVGKWAENLMTQIAALGRAAGIHLVIATQTINAEVLSGLILANFETRVAFSVADWRKSQLAIETSEADGLPVGRLIFRRQAETVEYQSCYITPQQIRLEIARIRRHGPAGGLGEQGELDKLLRDCQLIVATASQHFGGECSRAKILGHPDVRGAITHERFNELCRKLEQDGVLESGRGNRARRVARGFVGRPHLLELLYRPDPAKPQAPNSSQTADSEIDCGLPAMGGDLGREDAQNSTPENDAGAVCGLEKNDPPAPPPQEETDPGFPGWFGRAFLGEDDEDKPGNS